MSEEKNASQGDKIRIARKTNEAMKAVAEKSGHFSVSQLADAILREACAAIEGAGSAELPTVSYLRILSSPQIAPAEAALAARMKAIEEKISEVSQQFRAAETQALRLNEMPKPVPPFDPRPATQPAPRGNTG